MLVGFPVKEFKIHHPETKEEQWVSEDVLEHYIPRGYVLVNDSRMSYAIPAWVPSKKNENGTILILDDYNRADKHIKCYNHLELI